jgi:ATPase subunit of ABC transporter with duplicated ATPase domains
MDEGKKHRDQLLVLEAERSALLTAADLDDQQAVYDGRLAAMVEAAGNDEAAKEAAQAAHKACMAEVDAARAALAENDAWALRARKGIKEEAEAEAEALKAAPALEAAEAEAEAAKEAAAAALKAATATLKKTKAIEAGYQAEMVTLEGWGSLVARTRRCRVVGPPAGPPIVMLGQKRPKLRHHR